MRYFHNGYGCPTFRDTTLTINPLPIPQIVETPLRKVTLKEPFLLCETNDDIELVASPNGGVWSSIYPKVVLNDTFKPNSSPTDTTFYINYDFTSIKGCKGADSVSVLIEALQEVEILYPDTTLYRDSDFSIDVSAKVKNAVNITWIPFAGGNVDSSKTLTTTFTAEVDYPNEQDSCIIRNLYVQTDPGNACPFVDDLLTVTICRQKYNPNSGIDSLHYASIGIYPNPSNGSFRIDHPFPVKLTAINSVGQEVEIEEMADNNFSLSPAGLYTLILRERGTGRRLIKHLLVY
mgnify:CR=1 FL=1